MRYSFSPALRCCISAILASSALAAPLATHAADQEVINEVVVTGTRVADRSRLDTVAPVDVLPSESLSRQGTTELAQALSTAAPSINFPRPAISDGSDHIRPATLRGLAPDQTLVLVNSKRRHQSALVNVNGSIGRGSAAVDLNAIPLAAIERVEVLRDGASAQYGSDAIAGVINLQLRKASEGGNASVTYGEYHTEVDTARGGSRDVSDGATLTASAWSGFRLGSEGFLTVSAEYRDRDPTNRSDFDPRVTPNRVTARYGDSATKDKTIYLNAGVPLNDTWDLYGWAGYQNREGQSAANFRPFNNAGNVVAVYPNGFLPFITTDIDDLALAFGTKGELGGWDTDISLVYGANKLDYGVENSINATLGATSPTSFAAGGLNYDQLTFNLGFVRAVEMGSLPVNVAWGLEARRETFSIDAGERASWVDGDGPLNPTIPPGSQGFPGLQPSNEVDENRTAYSAYLDLESQMTEKFLASLAVRAEDYSDFGSAATGKLSARYDFTREFALRGTVATGFRAPGLQQEFFSATSTNFIAGVPFEVATFPATSAIARSLGAKDLDAEKSVNYSLGTVFRTGGFEATIDAYRIEIDDRIVLSENLQGNVLPLITPFGGARFFINGVDTRTQGVDVVLRQRLSTDSAGKYEFTLSGNYNETDVTKVPNTARLSALNPPPVLFGTINVRTFEEGTPKEKLAGDVDWATDVGFGSIGANVKATYYGNVTEPSVTPNSPAISNIEIGSHTLVDLAVRAEVGKSLGFALGVDNAFDEYPNQVIPLLNGTGALGFSRYSPFGFNGRFYYGRMTYNW